MNRLFSRDLWGEIMESITANGFRTIITSFGVFWGIFILVLLLASSKGLENGVKKGFSGIATNTVFIWAQKTSKPYQGRNKGRQIRFRIADANAIQTEVKGLEIVSPRNRIRPNVTRNLNEDSFNVYGDYPDIFKQRTLNMVEGRFLNQGDIDNKRKVVVIGTGVKSALYNNDEEAIGTFIQIQGVSFMVVGIHHNNSTRGNPVDRQKDIYTPFTTFSVAFNMNNRVGFFAITAKSNRSITKIKGKIIKTLKKRHRIHPEDDRAVGNFDLFERFNQVNGLFKALRLVSYFVGFLILLSGIIGISNIMLIVIKERTKEIGVRRALGASPASVRSQILMESLFLTIMSGMSGVSFGALIIFVTNNLLDKYATKSTLFVNPSIDLGTILLALVILVICGLLAGLIPAQTAIKIKPIEALRTE